MALKPLNSVGGFSVGEIPQTIVDSNANVTANYATFSGNLSISNATAGWGVLTDNLYYSNGQPWDLQEAAGSNTQIQFNNDGDFGASANFTFDTSTSLLTVLGNAQFNNANLGNLATANYINVSSNLVTSNLTINSALSGNAATFSGNVVVPNLSVNLDISGNTATFSGNVVVPNLSVNLELQGNTANFDGNVTMDSWLVVSNTANVGNLRTDNLLYSNGQPWDLQEAAGANYEIQYNLDDNFAADANFTFNPTTSVLTVTGNANVTNTLLTPNVNSGTSNLTLTSNGFSTVYDNTGNVTFPANGTVTAGKFVGNVEANITITAANTSILFSDNGLVAGANGFTFDKVSNTTSVPGNLDVADYLNVTSNAIINNLTISQTTILGDGNGVQLKDDTSGAQLNYNDVNFVFVDANGTQLEANGFVATLDSAGNFALPNNLSVVGNIANVNNISITNALDGNTANFSGNISALNANLGNLAQANFVNVANALTTFDANVSNLLTVTNVDITSNLTVNNLTVNLELAGNTANFTSNVTVNNLAVNVNLEGNTANFSGNISALNANLGNIVDANYIRTGEVYNGNTKIILDPNANITLASAGSNVVVINNLGANVVGYIQANGEVAAGSVLTGNVTSNVGNLTLYAQQSGNSYIQLRTFGDGQIDAGNARIQDLADPINGQDAATKFYVDTVAEGLHVHASAEAATPNTLAVLSGGVVTYNNGTAGVGATLVTTGSYTLIDSVNIATVGTRILVKNEANAAHNGIYVYTNSTTLTRATDYDTAAEIQAGDFLFVNSGTLYNNTGWVQVDEVTTLGTDPIVFEQFSGVGQYTGANGISIVGTLITANVDNNTTEISGGNIIVKAGANLTTPNIGAATGTSLDLTGNIIAANINANAAITANTANITTLANIGNVVVSDNLLTNSANVNLALTGNTANFSGNVVVNNLTTNLELTGNTANFSGNITTLNANLGNLATANYINVANTLTTLDANVTGTLTVANANIGGNLSVNNLTVNLELAGNTANFSGNVVVNNLTTNLELAGNTANFTGNLAAANLVTTGTANVANLNVTANVTSDLIPSANLTYDLGANAYRWDNVYAGNLNISGNIVAVSNIEGNVTTSNVFVANTAIDLGNTSIYWGQVTTTSIAANQTISTIPFSGVTGVEWLVKGTDSTGAKYSMAMVTAVTDGANADFSTFGTVNLGSSTGTLAVNIVGSNIELQVTPSSSNSTTWVTQYRTI
jgi:cytoskeletal protein CcmA (bactofilin family)